MLLTALFLAEGTIRFLGSPQCPDEASVEARLRAVAPSLLDSATRRLVMLETRDGGLRVRLFNEEGQELEDRFLPGPMTCREWAGIAAALLATWATDLAAPPVVQSPAPAALQATPPRVESRAGEPVPKARWHGEVGLGISGALASNGTSAVGGELWAGLAPPRGAFGGELVLSGTGSRPLPVGGGSANWQRFAAGFGGYGTLGGKPLSFEIGGVFLVGLLRLRGTGYVEPLSAVVFDPGIGVSGRALWRFAPAWLTWVQLGASIWPKRQEVQVLTGSTIAGTQVVPPVDFSLTLGLSLAGDL
jgi:hypothetical protein